MKAIIPAFIFGVICAVPLTGFAQVPVDSSPPVVAVTAPVSGAAVATGTVLRAVASDDVAVAAVQFSVDGLPLAESRNAPYWISWDTSPVAEGLHIITATARDGAGNTTSADIAVTVDRTAPVLAVTSPVVDTVTGLVKIAANASDNFGIDRVWFTANGVSLGEDAAPPYEFNWETALLVDGAYKLKVAARDHAGSLNSVETVVVVANGTTHIQDSDPAILYTGYWSRGNSGLRAWSGSTAAIATLTEFSARAALPFVGTGVTWIGFAGPQAGIANVYIDGNLASIVDLYAPAEHVQSPVFAVRDLAPGPHTVIIEATGRWNAASTDPFVVIDAFVVVGTLVPGTPAFENPW